MKLFTTLCFLGTGLAVALSSLLAELPGTAFTMPETYSVAEPEAPVVTVDNLLESDRFWPYHVMLTKSFAPHGKHGAGQSLPAGIRAVLIRVDESAATLRLDFGRDGVQEVPVGATDFLDRANAVRLGKETKVAPNFVYLLASRLVDPSQERLSPYRYDHEVARYGFICAIAGPDDLRSMYMAKELRKLGREHPLWLTIYFPLGQVRDTEVRDILCELDWRVPFLYDHLSESYVASLLPEGLAAPAILVVSKEGRLDYASTWSIPEGPVLDKILTRMETADPESSQ